MDPLRTQVLSTGQSTRGCVSGKVSPCLERAYKKHKLTLAGQLTALQSPAEFSALLRTAAQRNWVVYAKRPFAGPAQVLTYLSRYTHRIAIANSPLMAMNNAKVTFRWRAYAHGHQTRTMTLEADEFLRRFLLPVLPVFVRIRYFGLLANPHRAQLLALCRSHRRPCHPHRSQRFWGISVNIAITASCASLRYFLPSRFPPGSIHLSRRTLHDPSLFSFDVILAALYNVLPISAMPPVRANSATLPIHALTSSHDRLSRSIRDDHPCSFAQVALLSQQLFSAVPPTSGTAIPDSKHIILSAASLTRLYR
jgi:hypothetical protein